MTGTDVVDATGAGRPKDGEPTPSGAEPTLSGAEPRPSGAEPTGEHARGEVLLREPRWRDRMSTTLEVIRANPTGRVALKVVVGLAGLLVVAVGALLIPLPGPGWLIVLGGLGIWAIEFSWARRLLTFTRRNLRKWTRWVGRQSWTVRIAIGLFGMVFVSAVVWASVWFSFDVNLATEILDRL